MLPLNLQFIFKAHFKKNIVCNFSELGQQQHRRNISADKNNIRSLWQLSLSIRSAAQLNAHMKRFHVDPSSHTHM